MSEATKTNLEVNQQAVLETKPVTPRMSPAERARAETAGKVRHEVDEGNMRNAFDIMVDAEDDSKYVAEAKRVTTIKRDAATGKEVDRRSDLPGHIRRNNAEGAIKLVNRTIREGWPTTKDEQDALIGAIEPAFSKLWPDARAFLSDARRGDARTRAFVEEKLQDPRVREILQDMLEKRVAVKPPEDLEVPAELARKQKEAQILVDQNTKAEARVDTDLARVQKDLKDAYGDPTATPPRPGSRDVELTRLRANKGTIQSNVTSLTRDIQTKEARLNQLINARASAGTTTHETFDAHGVKTGSRTDARGGDPAAIQAEITTLQNDLDNPTTGLKKQLRDNEAELTKLKEYEDDQKNWTAEVQRLKQEKQVLADKGELLKADLEGLTEQTQKVIEARTEWEKQYVGKLESIMADGMGQYIQEQLQAADQAQQKLLEEEEAKAEDPAEKEVIKQMRERWNKRKQSGFIRTKEVTVPDKEKIDADYDLLMDPTQGPREVMRRLMRNTMISDPSTGMSRLMTTDEVNAKLDDKDFVDKMQGEVLATLLQKKMRVSKIADSDFEYMADSPWGDKLEAALTKRGAADRLKAQAHDLGIDAGKMHEFFSTKGKKKGLLLAILLGIVTVGVVPGMMVKEIITGQGT